MENIDLNTKFSRLIKENWLDFIDYIERLDKNTYKDCEDELKFNILPSIKLFRSPNFLDYVEFELKFNDYSEIPLELVKIVLRYPEKANIFISENNISLNKLLFLYEVEIEKIKAKNNWNEKYFYLFTTGGELKLKNLHKTSKYIIGDTIVMNFHKTVDMNISNCYDFEKIINYKKMSESIPYKEEDIPKRNKI